MRPLEKQVRRGRIDARDGLESRPVGGLDVAERLVLGGNRGGRCGIDAGERFHDDLDSRIRFVDMPGEFPFELGGTGLATLVFSDESRQPLLEQFGVGVLDRFDGAIDRPFHLADVVNESHTVGSQPPAGRYRAGAEISSSTSSSAFSISSLNFLDRSAIRSTVSLSGVSSRASTRKVVITTVFTHGLRKPV